MARRWCRSRRRSRSSSTSRSTEAGARAAFHLRANDGGDVPGALQMHRRDAALHAQPAAGVRPELPDRGGRRAGQQRRRRGHGERFPQHVPQLCRCRASSARVPADGDRHAQPVHRLRDPLQRADRPGDGDGEPPDDAAALADAGLHLWHAAYPATQMRQPAQPTPSSSASAPSPRPIMPCAIGPNIADPYGNITGQIARHNLPHRSAAAVDRDRLDRADRDLQRAESGADRAQLGQYRAGVAAALPPAGRRPEAAIPRLVQPDAARYGAAAPLDGASSTRRSISRRSAGSTWWRTAGGSIPASTCCCSTSRRATSRSRMCWWSRTLNLTLKAGERDALVWANDLQSGQPVAGSGAGVLRQPGRGAWQCHHRCRRRGADRASSAPRIAA